MKLSLLITPNVVLLITQFFFLAGDVSREGSYEFDFIKMQSNALSSCVGGNLMTVSCVPLTVLCVSLTVLCVSLTVVCVPLTVLCVPCSLDSGVNIRLHQNAVQLSSYFRGGGSHCCGRVTRLATRQRLLHFSANNLLHQDAVQCPLLLRGRSSCQTQSTDPGAFVPGVD